MYESHFGLLTKPFQLRPDPDFFFSSSGHKRALSYLQYGLTQGEGFIVVTGDIGTGKTTLMRSLLESITHDNIIAAQLVTTKLEADDLLRMICSAFNLPAENKPKAVLLQQFETFLRQVHDTGKRVLLIVDEAQNLPASALEELRMLSNFQLTDAPLLQSFLLGQPELRNIIQDPSMEQFRQRVIASCHLQPLKPEEVKDYIVWRLTVAGWAQNPRFTESCFAAIYSHTGGVPRRINVFCDRLLLLCFLEDILQITPDTIRTVAEELAEELSADPIIEKSDAASAVKPANSALQSGGDNGPTLDEVEAVRKKLVYVNAYLNESLEERIELLKLLDKKLKQRINLVVNRND
ncbi:XrtA/PEP-CTERM system-associated ATPase [Motiliproteus sediminis]|uniref:XrtA/PEP-CTERM system-associated ATPase n=1 Tax=Motiliproteus sediminis TaxID=1468178 RepID=UPI001AEFC16C|nr:XrtA/PEP-CTERM system-associated ATPase [Motiliproteus sediminis]